MEGIFIKLLNLSIQASILITVVLLLRFILNNLQSRSNASYGRW